MTDHPERPRLAFRVVVGGGSGPRPVHPARTTTARQLEKDRTTSPPRVAERMLEASGFEVLERGCLVSPKESPDAEPAWRALEPAVPALRHGDPAAPRHDVLAATDRCSDHRGVYRLRNDHQFVMRRRLSGPTALWVTLFVVAFGTNVPTPLLLVYRDVLGLSATALTGAFGMYAAGLVPALLLAGPASDRFGRRRLVVPASLLAALTSLLFLLAGSSVVALFAGRFLQGAVSGVVFSVGTAWLGELVAAPDRAARRTTAALSAGWGLGPLTAGILGQWMPAPTVLPYLVHVAMMGVAIPLLSAVPETLPPARRRRDGPVLNLGVPRSARWPFTLVVLPVAVGVFTFPSTAVTVLPLLLIPALPGIAVAVTGLVAAVTLLTGVLTQPLHRRLPAAWSGPIGLAAGAAGLALSLVAAGLDAWPVLVPAAVLLGAGYGLCLAAGLTMVARLAPPAERGALTGTFYACAYLGFGVPLLLSAVGGDAGLGAPLAGLAIVAAAVAVVLTLPPLRRLALSAATPVHHGRAAR